MRQRWIALTMLLAAVAPAGAQTPLANNAPPAGDPAHRADLAQVAAASTGDALHDRIIVDADYYAARYPQAFVAELNRYYGLAPEDMSRQLRQGQLSPGNLLYACALAQAATRPCTEIVQQWRQVPSPGWEAIGTAVEVTGDEAQARRLDARLRATYARWARPLPQPVAGK